MRAAATLVLEVEIVFIGTITLTWGLAEVVGTGLVRPTSGQVTRRGR